MPEHRPVAGSQEIAVGEARPGWRPQARIVGAPAGQPAEPMLLWCELAAAAGHVTVSNKGDPKNSLSRKRLGSAVPRGIACAFAAMDGLA